MNNEHTKRSRDRRDHPQRVGLTDDPRREPAERTNLTPDTRREPGQQRSSSTEDPRREQPPPRPDAPLARPTGEQKRVGGVVEARAIRGRADPRRDPTHPQQIPIRGPNATFDPRTAKVVNDPRLESASSRRPAAQRSLQPSAAGPPSKPATPAGDGRRYPSQPGAGNAQARNSASPASASSRPNTGLRSPAPQAHGLYCEIDGLSVEINPQDLSNVGLFVQTPSPPPADSEVRVFLRVGALSLEASGHVVQSVTLDEAKRARRRPGFGLLFTELEDNERAVLRDALDTLNQPKPPNARGLTESSKPRAAASSGAPMGTAVSAPPARPQASAAPAVDPKERELLERLRAELAALASQPAWTILGISQSADETAARQAFFAASKKYHPHAYARYALPEIKTVVTQLFIAYKRAFTSMTKSGRGSRNREAQSGRPSGRTSDSGNR